MMSSLSTLPVPATLPPLLKWAGGKRWLIPTLRTLWQPDRRLVEPFCGGLAVALGLNPQQALLNDANPLLINLYRQLQAGRVTLDPQWANEEVTYYRLRDRFNALIEAGQQDTPEAAGLLFYLNRTGYNGLCRFNQKGLYNVPFGRYARLEYQRDFSAYQPVLDKWVFQLGDFGQLAVGAGDWVYADPPYDVEFTSYSQGGFSWADQERLAHWLAGLPCPVVVSNQATDRILVLYRDLGFEVRTLEASRAITRQAIRPKALEMLATKQTIL